MAEWDDRFVAKEDVLAAHLDGEAVLLDMESRSYFQLNETAAVVWKQMENPVDRGALLGHVCQEFEVERDEAADAIDRLLDELLERGLICRERDVAQRDGP